MYDGLATVSDNFSFLAHIEIMKSWDALESNKMMIGISSTVVWLLDLSAELPLMLGLWVLCPSWV
jgi:hypothetical protein